MLYILDMVVQSLAVMLRSPGDQSGVISRDVFEETELKHRESRINMNLTACTPEVDWPLEDSPQIELSSED